MFKIKCSGIYYIQHDSGYCYIGKSRDIFSNRWSSHYTLLKQGKHHSPMFQELFNNSNITEWTFRVIFYVSKTDLKKETKLKGKEFDKYLDRFLNQKEKEIMNNYSINLSLNKNNKSFN